MGGIPFFAVHAITMEIWDYCRDWAIAVTAHRSHSTPYLINPARSGPQVVPPYLPLFNIRFPWNEAYTPTLTSFDPFYLFLHYDDRHENPKMTERKHDFSLFRIIRTCSPPPYTFSLALPQKNYSCLFHSNLRNLDHLN
jgi:hypothetical protein